MVLHSTNACNTAVIIMIPLQKVYFKRSHKKCYDIILVISRISCIKFIFGAVFIFGSCSICVISASVAISIDQCYRPNNIRLINPQVSKRNCLKSVPLSEQKKQYVVQ